MLIGALSFVMQVCCGTSRKRSRRSTLTACWMNGMRITIPGPRAPCRRPKKKTTSRSYSRTMWMVLEIRYRTTSRPTTRMIRPVRFSGIARVLPPLSRGVTGVGRRLNDELEAITTDHLDRCAGPDLDVIAARRPSLAASIGDPVRRQQGLGGAALADQGADRQRRVRHAASGLHQAPQQHAEVVERECDDRDQQ